GTNVEPPVVELSWREVEDYVEQQLRPLDVECMRALHEKVNIVPVLAKADSLTPAEVRRKKFKNSIPFAVIGSNLQVECDGRRFRAVCGWLFPPVENPEHSDFLLLRTMLVRTHMQDLKDVTRENHYENYRAQCIQSMTRMVVQAGQSHSDIPLALAVTDSEKERLILEKDEELRRMQEVLDRIQEQMQQNCRGDGF
ncbi:hypothetical protein CRUP_000973, partial [Coryphaenoides rupestris]